MAKKKSRKKTAKFKPLDPNLKRRPDRDRRVRQSERIARVLAVLNLIQSRGRWNAGAIADELECSERTVYRDLEVLEFAGVPWFFDETAQCYRVRADYRFPTLALTADELVGQAIATVLSRTEGLNVSKGAGPTTRKIGASKENASEVLSDVAKLIEVFDLKITDHSRHGEMLRTVQHALLARTKVTGTCVSPYEDGPRKLVVDPYRLCLIKRAWYLIGRLDGEGEAKTLRVARFRSLRELQEPAAVPEDFDVRTHFGNAWSVYRGEQSYDVELKFDATAAVIAAETAWHHTQRVTKHRDGRAIFKFTVDGLNEIVRWILTWTGEVEVVNPPELRRKYIAILQEGIASHS